MTTRLHITITATAGETAFEDIQMDISAGRPLDAGLIAHLLRILADDTENGEPLQMTNR